VCVPGAGDAVTDAARGGSGLWHGAVRVLRVCVCCLPAEARRPASWLALACVLGAGVALSVPDTPGRPPPGGVPAASAALVAGAAAAIAAVGDVPNATARGPHVRSLVVAATICRSTWPLVPAVALGLAGLSVGVWLAAAVPLAATSSILLRRADADAAESAGVVLVAACVASATHAAVSMNVAAPLDVAVAAAAGVAGFGAVMVAAVSWLATAPSSAHSLDAGSWTPADTIEALGWPAGSGRLGGGLLIASMIAALLGMAGWLFLAPERSGWYGLLAACCFVALAAPRATLAWGAVGSIARSRLLATVAGPGLRSAPQWRVPITTAAILAWPPLVAAGVVGGEQATDRLWLVAEVLAWGVALAVVTTAALRLGAGRETVLAIVLVTAVACFLGWRGVIGPETPGNEGWNGVEQTRASCETPQPRSGPGGPGRRPMGRRAGLVAPHEACTASVVYPF